MHNSAEPYFIPNAKELTDKTRKKIDVLRRFIKRDNYEDKKLEKELSAKNYINESDSMETPSTVNLFNQVEAKTFRTNDYNSRNYQSPLKVKKRD